MKIVIPARRNSKGLPFKNRKLFDYTLDTIPEEYLKDVIVSTDDEVIIEQAANKNLNCVTRKEELCLDDVSIRDVMNDIVEKYSLQDDETVIMLYLTYPERTWKNIEDSHRYFIKNNANSLLCKKDLQISPFLCMIEDGIKGKQITSHDLYRRQDYPKCFEASWIVCIFKVGELNNLNKNMYNGDTIFFKVGDVVDVDTLNDLNNFYKKNKN
jgi:CMP-N-acetylneuraminic acid synthetase